jgi:SOUL heme-binding protein
MKLLPIAWIIPGLALLGSCEHQKRDFKPLAGAPEGYVNEAKLPVGWPNPGPYGVYTIKEYPAYRAALSQGKGETVTFWKLFRHIQSRKIPMTAPVELEMVPEDQGLEMTSMSFLYQDQKVGQTGDGGLGVEVKDLPSVKVLSFAWQGSMKPEKLAEVRKGVEEELKKRGLKAKSFRLFGYNGPQVEESRKTYELQAVLEK